MKNGPTTSVCFQVITLENISRINEPHDRTLSDVGIKIGRRVQKVWESY